MYYSFSRGGRRLAMNRWFNSIFFYGLIFLVLIAFIVLFIGQGDDAEEYNIQESMEAMSNGEVKDMTMQTKNKIMRITGVLEKNEKPFLTQVPDNTDIVASITERASEQSILKIEEEEQPSAFVSFLTMMLPFLIIGLIFRSEEHTSELQSRFD